MGRFFAIALGLGLLTSCAGSYGLWSVRDDGDVVIDDLSLSSDRYTGWIYVGKFSTVTLDAALTDANDSVADIEVTCQTSNDPTTANGSGFDLPGWAASTTANNTVLTGLPLLWTWDITVSKSYSIFLTDLGHKYVNCKYAASGTAAAADKVTVTESRGAP